ncbi:ABC transporter substrate-binding protein [Roseomonas elaeocarpi]|uniref:ABC transporter substrate-binding protein n=1 Tax=Roseomonas elaeocarpi TaxID=907779 RepID=A0ABV6JYU3_9PROT
MDRRSFLKAGTGLGGTILAAGGSGRSALAQPAVSRGAAAGTLRFVPQSNLANFDPIWGTQFVVRNAATMVWDTLYGVDSRIRPQRQMVESEETSADGLTWTFRLRPGLRFHDGTPVLSRDVVASLNRWAVRDPMGQMIRAIQQELVAVDDRSFRWVLRKPYPKLLLALGKTNAPIAFIMPERIAKTDPFQQIKEYVGSGPFRFLTDEWVPGAQAHFARFDGYAPREEKPDWLAGGKHALVDRIEWKVMPDPATAVAALQNNEVDWWENPITDLVPVLQSNPDLRLDIADPLGNIGVFRMNHLLPPFDKPEVRRVVLMAIDQEDCMRALVGEDHKLWRQVGGYFTPDTTLYTEAGGEILKGPRNLDAARAALKASGYDGTPVVMLVAQDQPIVKTQGDVTAEALRSVGFNVDYVATDWGTTGTRRASKSPVSQGGWNIFFSWFGGADCANPAGYSGIRANGDGAWFGWPSSPAVEKARDEWFDATDEASAKAAIDRLNAAAVEDVVFAPTGFFLAYQAWRKNVSGVIQAPMPIFWGVSKA